MHKDYLHRVCSRGPVVYEGYDLEQFSISVIRGRCMRKIVWGLHNERTSGSPRVGWTFGFGLRGRCGARGAIGAQGRRGMIEDRIRGESAGEGGGALMRLTGRTTRMVKRVESQMGTSDSNRRKISYRIFIGCSNTSQNHAYDAP
jgi:hypothetical protein